MIKRLLAITKKELKQVRRDFRTIVIVFIFPVFMLILFGYALNFDVTNIKIAVYDRDKSELSREYIHSLESSGYFSVYKYITNQDEVNKALDKKEVQCVIVIPDNLSEGFFSNENVKIQYLLDGIDGNTATIIMSYVNAATRALSNKYTKEFFLKSGIKQYSPIEYEPLIWFNPELTSIKYLIPGLIATILITLAVVLTAIAIVREKELGTIEQLKVSPVTSFELILGKIIPYTLLSFLISAIIIIAGYFVFGVEIKGNIFLLFISILFYLFASLNIGIFVSTIADSQQVAFQMGLLISQLPSQLLSGFIFPIESMPKAVQLLSNITPAKYFIIALRDIMIKGVGLKAFWDQLLYLFIFALILLLLSTLKMRRQKEI